MKLLENFIGERLESARIPAAMEKFRALAGLLKRENEKFNLTSLDTDEEIEIGHFLDSLAALEVGVKNGDTLLDAGSGAGFPALPLKIVLPRLVLSCAEATQKKAAFIEYAAKSLGFDDVKVYPVRSEELPRGLRESFDWTTARALAKPAAAAELTLPWARVGGKSLLYTASSVGADTVGAAAEALGGGAADEIAYELPRGEKSPAAISRKIIIIPKIRPTPAGYPRRPGIAARKPLV